MNCVVMIEIVGKITINPVHAKVKVTLADAGQLYMERSLLLQAKKETTLQNFCTVGFLENTHIFPRLTHLQPEVRFSDGQIPPESLTGP